MLYEKGNQVGRYIKALIDRPNGGDVKKGEIGQIIGIGSVDFPSQKDYCISNTLDPSRYELLPVDYVPTPRYVAQPFPSDGKYIKLIVKHDINRKDVGTPGRMPNVIPKGTVTWCNKSYKSNILNNSTICIEGNVYGANINSSCFEVHPDSKHLFEDSKFQLPERWAVKCFKNPQDTPELLEWRINKGVDNYWSTDGCISNVRTWKYNPFDGETEITYDQFITHVYQPWKESSKSIDSSIKIGDTVRVVHVSPTAGEWVGVGEIPVPFKIGDIVTVSSIGNGYKIDKGSYYPRLMFEKVDKKELSIDSTPPVLEPVKPTHKFKVGDSVVVVSESDGWGEVKKGDIGVVKTLESDGGYCVDFPNQSGWFGTEECFRALQYTYTSTISTTDYSKLVETIWKSPISDVETIGIQLTKKSKTKLLSI
jgi:hypothetical protein